MFEVLKRGCGAEVHATRCCETGRNAYMRSWNAKHPAYTTKYSIASHLRQRFGMTVEDRRNLLREQDGLCMVCLENPATDLDRNHITGEVRGMLCHLCNVGLGSFRDDPDILSGAVTYLALTGTGV